MMPSVRVLVAIAAWAAAAGLAGCGESSSGSAPTAKGGANGSGAGGAATAGTSTGGSAASGGQAAGTSAGGSAGDLFPDDVPLEVGGPTGDDTSGVWPEPTAGAAVAVAVGKGSYADKVPDGVVSGGTATNIAEMGQRKLYVTDPNQPIPTNDWWTALVMQGFGANLFAYPLVATPIETGVNVRTMVGWDTTDENGFAANLDAGLRVTASGFAPVDARAASWSDWALEVLLEESAERSMLLTVAHGMPYVWIETKGIEPLLAIDSAYSVFDAAGDAELPVSGDHIGVRIGDTSYGVFAPAGTSFTASSEGIVLGFSGAAQFVAVATLPSASDLPTFYEHAYAVPRDTRVDYEYQAGAARVATKWQLTLDHLDGKADGPALQCWIPHHYKKTVRDFELTALEYFSPRGRLKCASGSSFTIAWPFRGILPKLIAPEVQAKPNPYQPERMKEQVDAWAQRTEYGNDTYWGGKDLIGFAKYMNFAYETQNTEAYETLKASLTTAMVDWFTYTPGETEHFFALYPRYGALIGFSPSYWSEQFTDNHFHYGYQTYAAGILALYDEQFAADYGEMATLVAKQYANYNREDKRFPWFRTFDPWMGHSYAGGTGDAGSGNNQESSSEAMQSWAGLFLLGTALNNKPLRDAGAFGFAIEAQACAEYWFDRDGTNFPPEWSHIVATVIRPDHIGYWKYFEGGPIWQHAIIWLPISPAFYYLVEDYDYAQAEFEDAKQENAPDWIGSWGSGLGNVVLGFQQLFDPDGAAKEFDALWDAGSAVVHDVDTGGITYYYTHSNRTVGRVDWGFHTNLATSVVYNDAGARSVVAYNPKAEPITLDVYEGAVKHHSFEVPPRTLARELLP